MYKLIKNSNILTMDPDRPYAQAALVIGEYFAFVGEEAEARGFIEARDLPFEEIDGKGASLLPGFNDSHLHFLHYVKTKQTVNLFDATSLSQVMDIMEASLKSRKKEALEWLIGEGWNQDHFTDEKRFPLASDLDKISRETPIIIMRACFHIGVLNTKAMELMGVDSEFASRHSQYVGVDDRGNPNGIVMEYVFDDIKAKLPAPTVEELVDSLLEAQVDLHQQGITSVQSDDVKYLPGSNYPEFCRLMREAGEKKDLKVRYSLQLLVDNSNDIDNFFNLGFEKSYGNSRFKISCIKILADGSLGARTAYLRKKYKDGDGGGIAIYTDSQLKDMVFKSHEKAMPVAIHGIGDGAIEQGLNAIEYAQEMLPHISLCHGIVHAQITDKALIKRFKELGVGVFAQPIFINSDMHIVYDRVGKSLAESSYAWKSFKEAGVCCAYSSDAPVESFKTMANLYSAVTRKDLRGNGPYLAQEKVDLFDALEAYTILGARMSGEGDYKGMIKEGYLADFIIMDRQIDGVDGDALLDIRVDKTFVAGELVFER